MKKSLCFSILCALLLIACDDENDVNYNPSCISSCLNGKQFVCDANGNMTFIPCEFGCNGLVCASGPEKTEQECNFVGIQCDGNRVVACYGGKISYSDDCKNGCENGACKAACRTNEARQICEKRVVDGREVFAEVAQVCALVNRELQWTDESVSPCDSNACKTDNSTCEPIKGECESGKSRTICEKRTIDGKSGFAEVSQSCENVGGTLKWADKSEVACESNACNEDNSGCVLVQQPEGECKTGETQVICELRTVDGKQVYAEVTQSCESVDNFMKWKDGKTEACSSGFCKNDGSACGEGDCGDKVYSQSCDNNTVNYCLQNEIVTDNCGSKTCVTFKNGIAEGVDHAECLSDSDICQKAGDRRPMCIDYGLEQWNIAGGPYVAYDYICAETTNGKLYWYVPSFVQCADVCNSAGTACK